MCRKSSRTMIVQSLSALGASAVLAAVSKVSPLLAVVAADALKEATVVAAVPAAFSKRDII